MCFGSCRHVDESGFSFASITSAYQWLLGMPNSAAQTAALAILSAIATILQRLTACQALKSKCETCSHPLSTPGKGRPISGVTSGRLAVRTGRFQLKPRAVGRGHLPDGVREGVLPSNRDRLGRGELLQCWS